MNPADMLGDAQDHLAEKKGIALAHRETKPIHVAHTLDPAGERPALLQLGGDEEVFRHSFHHMPGVIAVLDRLQPSLPAANVDVPHEPLNLAAPVGGK